jgi:uncharacterized protein YjeT (DUF2065 family)
MTDTEQQPPMTEQPDRLANAKEKAQALYMRTKAAFTEHPAEAGESYGQHLWFSISMAGRLLACSVVLLIHGLFPFMCCHTASQKMNKCQSVMTERAKMTGCPEENAAKAE